MHEKLDVVERLRVGGVDDGVAAGLASSAAASSAAALQAPSTSTSPAGARRDSTPMRNAPGSAPTSAANGRTGGAAAYGSPGTRDPR